jgi:hypothetical protein
MAAARKVSAAHSSTFFPCDRNTCDSLPMVVVLPVPFTPTTRITSGVPSTFFGGLGIGRVQNRQQLFFQQALEFLHVFDLFAVGPVAEFAQNFLRGRGAEVGADQRGLEIVEGVRSISLPKETTSSMRSARFSRVRVTACFMRSKKPVFFSSVLPNRV